MNQQHRIGLLGVEFVVAHGRKLRATTDTDRDWYAGQLRGYAYAVALELKGAPPTADEVVWCVYSLADIDDVGQSVLTTQQVDDLRRTFRAAFPRRYAARKEP